MSGGIALLAPHERTGDAYKYIEMLRRADKHLFVCRTNHTAEIKKRKPKYAVVRGDHRSTYQMALEHGLPYILLEGDVAGMVQGPSSREQEMIENASAILFNCAATYEWCARHYQLPDVTEVVYLRPLAEQLRFEAMRKTEAKTICYAGGLQDYAKKNTSVGYRVYHDIFMEFMRRGWDVHVYCPPRFSNKILFEYAKIGCSMHPFVDEQMLPMMLSQYTCGLQTFNGVGPPKEAMDYCEIAVPNKTWLYLAAGIPTLGLEPTGAGARLYEGKWGIVTRRIETHYDFPPISDALRRNEVIDRDIDAFRRLLCAVSQA